MGYIWNFNKDAEIWQNDEHDTIDECLKEAKKKAEMDEHQTVVYIGECVPYIPEADCTDILDRMQEQAGEMCGDVGDDWCAYDWHKKEELEELNDTLTSAVRVWMKKYGHYPTCCNIQNIKKYVI